MNERFSERANDSILTDTGVSERAPAERGEIRRRTAGDRDAGFLPESRMDDLRGRWDDVQAEFVDDPRRAVQDAQNLVRDLVDELTETFRREREGLEGQWSTGGTADTEALRVTLQRYRSFFNRLLTQ
jgi:hypothetical protein